MKCNITAVKTHQSESPKRSSVQLYHLYVYVYIYICIYNLHMHMCIKMYIYILYVFFLLLLTPGKAVKQGLGKANLGAR